MLGSESSRRNALAMSIGWWYLRRLIRKRGTAAVAGFLAGEGLSFREPHKRHTLRWVVLGGADRGRRPVLVAPPAGWWRRLGRLGAGGARLAVPGRVRSDAGAGTRACRDVSDGSRFVRPSLEQIPPGDPIPGLAPGVASLGLNEGLSGPFPSALAAIAAATPTLNRYPERGSATLVRSARRPARRPGGAGLGRGGSGRADRLRLPGRPRPGRRGDRAVALVSELRPRCAEARCRAGPGAARRRRPARRRRRAGGGHAAHAPALRRDPEQPHRPRRSGGGADRARPRPAGARPAGDRRGVLRLPRSGRPLRRDHGSRPRR